MGHAYDRDYLSKTLFIKGLQCHKTLYLHKFKPELRDEISDSMEDIFQSGRDLGRLAQKLFPGGVEIEYEGYSHKEQIGRTREEMKKGTKTLYEATFSYDKIFIKADIMRKVGDQWNVYEVKGSTAVKDVYIDDISIQYYVLKGCGIPIKNVYLVYVNNEYMRDGELDIKQLFTFEKQTKAAEENQKSVKEALRLMRKALKGAIPEIDISEQCSAPYECDFHGYCWNHIPENSIFDLRGNGIKKFDLYRKGIIHLSEVPLEDLNFNQRIQVEGTLKKKNHINVNGIKEFLNSIRYPICCLDFETFVSAVPPFSGTRPYQQIPFQYSMHVLESERSKPVHREYLADPGIDPRKGLIEKLLADIPQKGSILSYSSFETRILTDLGKWFPKYAARIKRVIERIIDLMAPFRSKDLYLWQMNGSYSIKEVLPALVPEMDYEKLEISNGGMAMSAYFEMSAAKINWKLTEYGRICSNTVGWIL